jgi:hypothetical protein
MGVLAPDRKSRVLHRGTQVGGAKRSDARGILNFAFGNLGGSLSESLCRSAVAICEPLGNTPENSIRGAKLSVPRETASILQQRRVLRCEACFKLSKIGCTRSAQG